MSIILAVNGVVETYPVKPAAQRQIQVEAVEAQGNNDQRSSSSDRSNIAAHNTYQQQAHQDQHAKPALFARDLMTSPVLTLSSDSTVSDAWTIMTHKGFRTFQSPRCTAPSWEWYPIAIFCAMCLV